MPDSLLPAGSWGEPIRRPPLAERFLPPPEFVWGSFTTSDGAVLRWGHLPVGDARAETACLLRPALASPALTAPTGRE